MPISLNCQACGNQRMQVFYEAHSVPVHSVLLMSSAEQAITYPNGDIRLGFCERCGFISNLAFDSSLQEYSTNYEETQGYSPTFGAFHRQLAERLIERHALHKKRILEVGCGKGEFLNIICELGPNEGIGFDPAYVPERNHSAARDRITFVQDFYSEKYAGTQADLVCCKMTLEHIFRVGEFVRMVRRSVQDNTVVFFQIPNVVRVLQELAFWDIYYEHCSYFSPGSLARLFRLCGFEVMDLWQDYGDQYLMIEARPSRDGNMKLHPIEENVLNLRSATMQFAAKCSAMLRASKKVLSLWESENKRVVLWGGGSKAVAFLTTLGVRDEIQYAVDINPHRQGTFLPGSGHQIVAPSFLRDYRPEVVIIMNEIYRDEIEHELRTMGLEPIVITVQELGAKTGPDGNSKADPNG